MSRTLRPALVGALALAVVACSAPPEQEAAPTPPPVPPLAVHVAVPDEPTDAVTEWAHALETAIGARTGDLRLAADPASAGLVVRILAVGPAPEGAEAPGEGDAAVMKGALVAGEATREFSLTYRGADAPQAEALARNLHRFGDEMRKRTTPAPGGEPSPQG